MPSDEWRSNGLLGRQHDRWKAGGSSIRDKIWTSIYFWCERARQFCMPWFARSTAITKQRLTNPDRNRPARDSTHLKVHPGSFSRRSGEETKADRYPSHTPCMQLSSRPAGLHLRDEWFRRAAVGDRGRGRRELVKAVSRKQHDCILRVWPAGVTLFVCFDLTLMIYIPMAAYVGLG